MRSAARLRSQGSRRGKSESATGVKRWQPVPRSPKTNSSKFTRPRSASVPSVAWARRWSSKKKTVGFDQNGTPPKTGSDREPVLQPPTLADAVDKKLPMRAQKLAAISDCGNAAAGGYHYHVVPGSGANVRKACGFMDITVTVPTAGRAFSYDRYVVGRSGARWFGS